MEIEQLTETYDNESPLPHHHLAPLESNTNPIRNLTSGKRGEKVAFGVQLRLPGSHPEGNHAALERSTTNYLPESE